MNTITLEQAVANVRDLPSLPLVVMELISSFEDDTIGMAELAARIARDQALAAKTLRLANSSFYGLQSRVKTIDQALAVLGFDSVRALVTAAGVIASFNAAGAAGFDFPAFWRHAIGTAVCARRLAKLAGCNQEAAFVSGLLHDIGRLVLVTRFPRQYGAALAFRRTHDCDMLLAERSMLGIDHAVVGRTLAQHWKFPELIQRSIGHHHAPMRDDLGDIPSVVHVANVIVHALDLAGDPDEQVPHIAQPAWDSLRLEAPALERLCVETQADFESVCEILNASA
jgi:putative nucleotidyltransferase with HDIG domain